MDQFEVSPSRLKDEQNYLERLNHSAKGQRTTFRDYVCHFELTVPSALSAHTISYILRVPLM